MLSTPAVRDALVLLLSDSACPYVPARHPKTHDASLVLAACQTFAALQSLQVHHPNFCCQLGRRHPHLPRLCTLTRKFPLVPRHPVHDLRTQPLPLLSTNRIWTDAGFTFQATFLTDAGIERTTFFRSTLIFSSASTSVVSRTQPDSRFACTRCP